MDELVFDKDYITNIKKNIINYISRANINVNKITFNLSLYTNIVITEEDNTKVTVVNPKIANEKIIPATIEIGQKFFDIKDNTYYIKNEYEDELNEKITKILVRAASMNVKYENMKPKYIEGMGLTTPDGDGFDSAFSYVIVENVNGYKIPNFELSNAFNIGLVKMILALTDIKAAINSFFNHDKSFLVSLYSLSVDSNIYIKINKSLTLIERLINTLNSDEAKITEINKETLDKLIHAKKAELINMVINKLYIPYINNVPLDQRKQVRDAILKGFLGPNYANMKLNDKNRDNYYWASLINNTVPINNKVTEQAWNFFRKEAEKANTEAMNEIYAKYSLNKAKNNIKEFWVLYDNNDVYINAEKKVIKEKKLVNEMLSYAYISSIEDNLRKKIETGIVRLCSSNNKFTSTLKSDPLSNRMLVAAIIQLAKKNGFELELVNIKDNIANFRLKEKEPI